MAEDQELVRALAAKSDILVENFKPAFEALCDVLGLKPLISDSRFLKRSDRWINRAELLPHLQSAMDHWGQSELYDALVARGVVSAPIYTLDRTFADPQIVHRAMRQFVHHPFAEPMMSPNTLPTIAGPSP